MGQRETKQNVQLVIKETGSKQNPGEHHHSRYANRITAAMKNKGRSQQWTENPESGVDIVGYLHRVHFSFLTELCLLW